jgi:hypothetical protein
VAQTITSALAPRPGVAARASRPCSARSAPRTRRPCAVAGDDVDALDLRHDRAQRADVRPALRAGAEDEQAPGVGRREVAHGERRHRRRAQVRQADAVEQRGRRERLGSKRT